MVPCSTLLINQSSFFVSLKPLPASFLVNPNDSTVSRLLATAHCSCKCGVVIYQDCNQPGSN